MSMSIRRSKRLQFRSPFQSEDIYVVRRRTRTHALPPPGEEKASLDGKKGGKNKEPPEPMLAPCDTRPSLEPLYFDPLFDKSETAVVRRGNAVRVMVMMMENNRCVTSS